MAPRTSGKASGKTPKVPSGRTPKTPTTVTAPPPTSTSPTPAVQPPGDGGVDFRAANYTPTTLWEPSRKIPYIDESTFKEYQEQVRGEQRSVSIAQDNLILKRQLAKAEGLYVDAQIEGINTQIKWQELATVGVKLEQAKVTTQIEQAGLATLGVNLQQAQTKTQIEQYKLAELQHDANGHQIQAQLKQQTWDLKLDGLRHDVDVASKLLQEKRNAMNRQFTAA